MPKHPLSFVSKTRHANCLGKCVLVTGILAGFAPVVMKARTHSPPRVDPWIQAVALRQQLEATPPESRTLAQFGQVLDAFRRIYHENPQASKAPAAVASVADLLAEKGRVLGDPASLQAAVGQYEFLRKQYPKSPQVEDALLLEAEICRQDLKDYACAADKLHQVIAANPASSYSEQANLELNELDSILKRKTAQNLSKRTSKPNTAPPSSNVARNLAPRQNGANSNGASSNGANSNGASSNGASSDGSKLIPPVAADSAMVRRSETPTSQAQASEIVSSQIRTPQVQPVADSTNDSGGSQGSGASEPHRVVLITGMRHWSNPTSTRIAIDLGGKVEYEAARVPNPDRIFFDLHGARLAPSLNGHQVEVIDDGYLKRIRAAQYHSDTTRVVLDVTDVSQYSAFLLPNPWRLIIDIHSDKNANSADIAKSRLSVAEPSNATSSDFSQPMANLQETLPAPRGSTKSGSDNTVADVAKLTTASGKVPATAGPTSGPVAAKVPSPTTPTARETSAPSDLNNTASQTSTAASNKARHKAGSSASPTNTADLAPLPHAADPASDGQRSLVRALGLKVGRIVIDAGHGGHDSGTLGPGGIQEKDVVLDVALRVGKLLHSQLGAEIVYTRDTDIFVPLETRTAIANKAQADLFLSIHANSSPEPEARGVETYYLNFTSDPNALDVAARENAVSTQSVHQLSDLVRKITLKDKIDESREFAADVDEGLYAGLKRGNPGLKDRGVKKAPFVVLIGAQMPSILAEISFLTNPYDAEQLQEGSYRQRIAESLVSGVERYLRGLSGTRPIDKAKTSTSSTSKSHEEPVGQ